MIETKTYDLLPRIRNEVKVNPNIEDVLMSLIRELDLSDLHLVHIGAHLVEEAEIYSDPRISLVTWIEADSQLMVAAESKLAGFTNQSIYNAAIYKSSGQNMTFYTASNNGMSSSLKKFDRHKGFFPNVGVQNRVTVVTQTLDDFFKKNFANGPQASVLVFDIQGAELEALEGSSEVLKNVEIVVSEVSRYSLYKDQGLFVDIDGFLESSDFKCVSLIYDPEFEYGDAIWIKRSLSKRLNFDPIAMIKTVNPKVKLMKNKFLLLHRLRLLDFALRINKWMNKWILHK